MLKKVTRKNNRTADDIRESLREASNYFSGKTTKAIVHRVIPRKTRSASSLRTREDERGSVTSELEHKKP
jgi:hypothetical protein